MRRTGRAGHGMPRLLVQPEGRGAVVGGGIPTAFHGDTVEIQEEWVVRSM